MIYENITLSLLLIFQTPGITYTWVVVFVPGQDGNYPSVCLPQAEYIFKSYEDENYMSSLPINISEICARFFLKTLSVRTFSVPREKTEY
jgi:hypothetical protein